MHQLSVTLSNLKGGTGKTSIASHLAGMASFAGYRTLAVDLDPQGNLIEDFGATGDNGSGLTQALQFGGTVKPLRDVRDGLDIVPGGPYLADAAKLESGFADRGRNPHLVLADAIAEIENDYDLIVFDSPPGDRYLQVLAMCAAKYVVVPTRSDDRSIDGIGGVASRFGTARESNGELELLGVVIFAVGAGSTVIRKSVRDKVQEALGEVAPVFDSTIRYMEAPAIAARNRGMLVYEYQDNVVSVPRRDQVPPPAGNVPDRIAKTAGTLADDYARLVTEILSEMSNRSLKSEGAV